MDKFTNSINQKFTLIMILVNIYRILNSINYKMLKRYLYKHPSGNTYHPPPITASNDCSGGCNANARCSSVSYGGLACVCLPGYQGDGHLCTGYRSNSLVCVWSIEIRIL